MLCFQLLCVGLFIQGVLNYGSTETCPPAEEQKMYSFLGHFQHNLQEKLEILLRKNSSTPVSTCRNNLSCDNFNKSTRTTIASLGNNKYAFNVTIESMSRNESSLWEIKYLGLASLKISSPIFSCELKSFVKAKNVSCKESFENNILKIICVIYGIYPKARALLISTSSQSSFIMNCADSVTPTIPVYFTSVCQVEVPIKDMSRISDSRFVSVYPNVTGNDDDIKYSVNFTISRPSAQTVLMLQNCSEFVEEGSLVQCLCRPKDNSSIPTNVTWSTNTNTGFNTSNNWLSFQAKTKHTEFVCHGTSLAGVESVSIYYRPTVYSKIKNMTCSVEKITSNFVIKCFIYKVYPTGVCYMRLDNEHPTDELTTKNTSDGFYNTECMWKISINSLNNMENNVTILAYPNISDDERGRAKVVKYLLLINDVTEEAGLNLEEHIGPISIGAVSFLIILCAAIVFFLVLRRKKHSTGRFPEFEFSPQPKELKGPELPKRTNHIYTTIEDVSESREATSEGPYVNSTQIAIEMTRLLTNEYITPVDVEILRKMRNQSEDSEGYISLEESAPLKH